MNQTLNPYRTWVYIKSVSIFVQAKIFYNRAHLDMPTYNHLENSLIYKFKVNKKFHILY